MCCIFSVLTFRNSLCLPPQGIYFAIFPEQWGSFCSMSTSIFVIVSFKNCIFSLQSKFLPKIKLMLQARITLLSTWVGLDFALCQCLCDSSVAFAIFSHCVGGNMEQNLPNLCTCEVAHQAVFSFFGI